MPVLFIDIEGTIWAKLNEGGIDKIHRHQVRSNILDVFPEEDYKVVLINPKKLERLFEIACTKYEGVRFIICEKWPRSIFNEVVNFLVNSLSLTEATRNKLLSAPFHSSATDYSLFSDTADAEIIERNKDKLIDHTSKLKKNARIMKLVSVDPALQRQQIVFVDNSCIEITHAFETNKIFGVCATTHTSDTEYCERAIWALEQAQHCEQTPRGSQKDGIISQIKQTLTKQDSFEERSFFVDFEHVEEKPRELKGEKVTSSKKGLPMIRIRKADNEFNLHEIRPPFEADEEYLNLLEQIEKELDEVHLDEEKPSSKKPKNGALREEFEYCSISKNFSRKLEGAHCDKENSSPNKKSSKGELANGECRFHRIVKPSRKSDEVVGFEEKVAPPKKSLKVEPENLRFRLHTTAPKFSRGLKPIVKETPRC